MVIDEVGYIISKEQANLLFVYLCVMRRVVLLSPAITILTSEVFSDQVVAQLSLIDLSIMLEFILNGQVTDLRKTETSRTN